MPVVSVRMRRWFEFRPARDEDFPMLWPMLAAMGQTEQDERVVRERAARLIADSAHAVLVAEADGALLGYAWAHDYGPHLRSGKRAVRMNDLYVADSARRGGAGRRLFEAVGRWADDRGATWLQWQASEPALPFYERLGLTGVPCPDPEHPFFEIQF